MKKKLFATFVFTALSLTAFSQDRVDSTPESLSMKSQEITKALFWKKDSKTGKWKSNKNNARPYLGEGVHSDNFNTIFIGDFKGHRYLFLDFFKGGWRYPALEREWMYFRYILAGLLNEEQYNSLRDLKTEQACSIMPKCYNMMFKGDNEYSPALFLSVTETLRSVEEEKGSDEPIYLITVKRTLSDGQDVVRFLVYPHGSDTLIDFNYFEVSHADYMKLFQPDKTVKFK